MSARNRAPSESSNLTKKTSRTSDDNASARSANSRPHSPATFLQRHKTMDRTSLLESIVPKSSTSTSFTLDKTTAAVNLHTLLSDQKPPIEAASTIILPPHTASKSNERVDDAKIQSKSSSRSLSGALGSENPPQDSSGEFASSSTAHDTSTTSSGTGGTSRRSPGERSVASMQPTVTDANDVKTLTPKPTHEPSQKPSEAVHEMRRSSRPPTYDSHSQPSHKQPDRMLPDYGQQPPQAWYSEPSPQGWQGTASPPQSPVMHQYGGFQTPGQPQYPYDYSYAYNPQMPTGGYPPYSSPYYAIPFSPTVDAAASQSVDNRISRPRSGDGREDLMIRIQDVLPDLNRLLEQFREGQTPLATAEHHVRQAQAEPNEQLTNLQHELDATKKEYERVIKRLVDENCSLKNEAEDRQKRSRSHEGDSRGSRKLKSEFETLQAQHQDLASSVDSIRLSKEELMTEKLGVEKHIESLKKDKHSIKDSHHRILADLKAQHSEELAAKKHEHEKALSEHKSVLNKVQLDLATLISKHNTTKRDLEDVRSSESAYKASSEVSSRGLETAKASHDQQIDKLRQDHVSQHQRHESERKKQFIELEAFRMKETELEAKIQAVRAEVHEHKEALAAERQAHEALKAVHEERNKIAADLAGSMTSWRQKHAELQMENENLDRVLNALGFGIAAADSKPEPQQPAQPVILSDKTTLSEQADTSKQLKLTPIHRTGNVAKSLEGTSQEEPSGAGEGKDVTKAAVGTESLKEKNPAIREEVTKDTALTSGLDTAKVEQVPTKRVTTSTPETATKVPDTASQATAQVVKDPVVFRPIQYYKVPGQF